MVHALVLAGRRPIVFQRKDAKTQKSQAGHRRLTNSIGGWPAAPAEENRVAAFTGKASLRLCVFALKNEKRRLSGFNAACDPVLRRFRSKNCARLAGML